MCPCCFSLVASEPIGRGSPTPIARLFRGFAMAAALLIFGGIAAAQSAGLFETLFGNLSRPPPAASPVPPPSPSTSLPSITVTPRPSAQIGGIVAHCVRLCDGGHFPLPRLASGATPARLCSALCPGVRTRVYWGSLVDHAVAANGARYSNLGTAFKYRRARTDGCTCNGNDVFGTAAISIAADVTLRQGDIVVTDNGLQVFVGSRGDTHRPADFTPLQDYSGLSPKLRESLLAIPVDARPKPDAKDMTFNARIIFGFAPLQSHFIAPDAVAPSQTGRTKRSNPIAPAR